MWHSKNPVRVLVSHDSLSSAVFRTVLASITVDPKPHEEGCRDFDPSERESVEVYGFERTVAPIAACMLTMEPYGALHFHGGGTSCPG
jgi:hypothetical protein